jgi:hypothetical protein
MLSVGSFIVLLSVIILFVILLSVMGSTVVKSLIPF